MQPTRAIIFDLYGTLLSTPPPTLHREIPRLLGVRTKAWLELVRDKLLTQPFGSAEELAHYICEQLAPGAEVDREAECVEIITDQLAHVTPLPGVLSLLSFLRKRGYRLALLSNLSSSYKEPLERFALLPLFDATYFSCDEGLKKPIPETYLETSRRLEAKPDEILFIGDSIPNDIDAPRALGMTTIHVGSDRDESLEATHLVGLFDLSSDEPNPLLATRAPVRMPAGTATVRAIAPVADDEQGRYNLVYRVETDSTVAPVNFVKRFFLPESAYVEELAYRVQELIGLPTCRVALLGDEEPILAMTEARGRKYDMEIVLDDPLAREIGRHLAFAYVFSNADMRPRNAFLYDRGSRPEITMVDLEHCFFDLAIDPSGVADPLDPNCLDAASDLRVAKRVLTDRAMRRARRSFIQEENISQEVYLAFQSGFRDFFLEMTARRREIVAFIDDRVHRKPYLLIGTHSYRRAMASIDVRAIDDRLRDDPDHVIARCC